jgi:hypothetical protein
MPAQEPNQRSVPEAVVAECSSSSRKLEEQPLSQLCMECWMSAAVSEIVFVVLCGEHLADAVSECL